MKIYYDSKSESWYHTGGTDEVKITMGGEKHMIPPKRIGLEDNYFHVKVKNGHAGPLIGIMTARKLDGSIAGNSELFKELQKKLISHQGISFVFTPEGIQNHIINGYTFLPDSCTWMKIKTPFPDLVYNRIPFRSAEQDEIFYEAFAAIKGRNIPFFNPCFINKFDFYLLFQNHPILQKFLPKTEIIRNQTDFQSFLDKYQSVYLKPAQSSRGKGIFRISLINKSKIQLEGLSNHKIYPTLQNFWNEWETILINKNYIIQEEVHSGLYNGKRFDFRILAHAVMDEYQVTGVGIRQSQNQDVTTHIPNGGKLLSYDLLRTDEHDRFIKSIVDHIGKVLSEKLGFFGEFSIDAGISLSGNYYIYEVNSKPMRFDEEEIEKKKISQLCLLFLQLTHF